MAATETTTTQTPISPTKQTHHHSISLRLPLSEASAFDLEKAVCSHGLFMMAPNRWDPVSRTFHRPLRLSSSPSTSLPVSISQSSNSDVIEICVSGTDCLCTQDQEAILGQVRRMLRISEGDDRVVWEFHKLHGMAKKKGFGRIFRSPSLFEDMVKCMLLCNCTFSRTLAMAKALCALQLELKAGNFSEDFTPKTPHTKELKRKRAKQKRKSKAATKLETKFEKCIQEPTDDLREMTNESNDHDDEVEIGDFPTPDELAALDAEYLGVRCKLGYRAQRIVSLAQSVVRGDVQVNKMEELCNDSNMLSFYDTLYAQLLGIPGFGPFTCANVLMCLGYFHKIPADTETIRHLKSVHKINCAITTIEKEIVAIYGKYAPFQFLAYWFELWEYYEETFGKTSDMAPSDYMRITATNMKTTKKKRKQISKLFLR
ncbi:N-glycosylase/DNA lyase [Rhynchospora pubera]|uniref:N-glycosylase/DNA lyase n=1 Tax=Rhynchospora pubera TaxID=906938 RepID=A0AAV8FI98_9POAL|nr:N-glycosylase/DNA lyase [Rhynchospora pubera]